MIGAGDEVAFHGEGPLLVLSRWSSGRQDWLTVDWDGDRVDLPAAKVTLLTEGETPTAQFVYDSEGVQWRRVGTTFVGIPGDDGEVWRHDTYAELVADRGKVAPDPPGRPDRPDRPQQ